MVRQVQNRHFPREHDEIYMGKLVRCTAATLETRHRCGNGFPRITSTISDFSKPSTLLACVDFSGPSHLLHPLPLRAGGHREAQLDPWARAS